MLIEMKIAIIIFLESHAGEIKKAAVIANCHGVVIHAISWVTTNIKFTSFQRDIYKVNKHYTPICRYLKVKYYAWYLFYLLYVCLCANK